MKLKMESNQRNKMYLPKEDSIYGMGVHQNQLEFQILKKFPLLGTTEKLRAIFSSTKQTIRLGFDQFTSPNRSQPKMIFFHDYMKSLKQNPRQIAPITETDKYRPIHTQSHTCNTITIQKSKYEKSNHKKGNLLEQEAGFQLILPEFNRAFGKFPGLFLGEKLREIERLITERVVVVERELDSVR